MITFQYTARNSDNEAVSGSLEAASETAARDALAKQGFHAIQITPQDKSEPAPQAESSETDSSRSEVVFDEELGAPLEHITGAGLPLESGLRLLAETHPSPRVSASLLQLSERLSRGESWEQIAAGEHANLPPVYRELFQLKLGPGELAEVLNRYLHYRQQATETRRKIWLGLFYSMVILASLTLMIGFLMVELVPQFKSIFEGFDTELPWPTVTLIHLADFVRGPGGIALVVLIVAPVLIWLFSGRSVRRNLQYLTRWIPVTGSAFTAVSLSTFCHLLAELVRRRIPLNVSLQLAAAGSKDFTLQHECRKLSEQLRKGVPLSDAFYRLMHFRADVMNTFRWSSQPEQFVDALHATGDALRGQALARAGLIPLVIEPFLLFFVLVTAMTFAGVFMLPLIKLLNDLS